MQAGSRSSSSALAAAEPLAGLGDVHALRQGVDVDVRGAPQLAHDAVTMRTPFKRMLARVIGGPGLLRMVRAPKARAHP